MKVSDIKDWCMHKAGTCVQPITLTVAVWVLGGSPPPPLLVFNHSKGKFLRAHCMHTAHAEAGILTKVIRLVVTVLFPRNPFQKNEQSKNI